MGGDEPDAIAITQRELLLEMREDIRGLKAAVDAIARDQAAGVERRAAMQRSADSIYARLDGHDRDLDRTLAWQNLADGAQAPPRRLRARSGLTTEQLINVGRAEGWLEVAGLEPG